MSETPMTPAEFAERMRAIDQDASMEGGHSEADGILADLLRALGYGEGIDVYDAMHKYYI